MTLVRFAPSPTGRLHLGNARGALINWLFARRRGGSFLLRLDDTDAERSRPEFAAAIEEDLRWLGLDWDSFARQSDRLERYRAAFARLRERGVAYACHETAEELALARKARLAAGKPPVYDRAGLRLSPDEHARLEAEGRAPHWRFRLPEGASAWDDLIHGAQSIDLASTSDPVIMRADGVATYTLASVVDDLELGITHVIRGEDHLANTATHRAIAASLDPDAARRLAFAHFPLVLDAEGHKFSKRAGGLELAELRARGVEPLAIASLLARLGTSRAVEPAASLDELAAEFDLAAIGRASPRLSLAELDQLNARIVHALPHAAVAPRLAALGAGADEAFWLAVRGNLATVEEARHWLAVCRGALAPGAADPGFAASAASLLPPEPWSEATWPAWTRAVAAATGRKGRELYQPLRLALTAREHGPELKTLLPLIGRARVLARLRGETA